MATKTQKPSQEKEEKRKRNITILLIFQSFQTTDGAKERKSYQKRLLFKANDYLCKENNKRSLLMQKHATESTSLVSKSLPV